MVKVLVTGAAGRVGSQLVNVLLDAGHAARGFDLRPSGNIADGYEECIGKLQEPMDVEAAVSGVDTVFHLGAFMSWKPRDRSLMFQANVDGTRVLLEAAEKAGIRRFVFASSGEVYPENAPEHLPITEDHPLRPNSPYGLTKLLGEELVQFHARTGQMETVILRFSHTQDASELLDEGSFFSGPRFFLHPRIRQQESFGNHAIAALLNARDPGRPAHVLARNENGRPFKMHITDTRDMVAGLMLAMEHREAAGEIFNLGSTEPVEFEPLVDGMSAITGYPIVTVDFPGPGVYYHTANDRIRTRLNYSPQWTIDRMLDEAALVRRARAME